MATRDEVNAQRRAVIRSMVSSVMRGESREYHVGEWDTTLRVFRTQPPG